MQLPSDGKERTEAKTKRESHKIADNNWFKGKCSKRESCSFKHDITKKGKGRGKRDRPSSPSLEPRSQSKDSKDGEGVAKGKAPKGISPSAEPNHPLCFRYLKGKYTKPLCDDLHPPECVKHRTDERCTFWENERFSMQTTKRQVRSRRRTIGTVSGSYPGWTEKKHRNRNALAFENRDPNNTLWAEDDARQATWQ